jgi:hypothetical protein
MIGDVEVGQRSMQVKMWHKYQDEECSLRKKNIRPWWLRGRGTFVEVRRKNKWHMK